jgi:5-methylcytosine-specific restriction endonuclease McrA
MSDKLANIEVVTGIPGEEDHGWGKILDELKATEGITSDMALAKKLDVSRAFISDIRKFRKKMPRDMGEEILMRLGRRLTQHEQAMLDALRIRRRSTALMSSNPSLLRFIIFERAQEKCELCGHQAPFVMPSGMPYFELHFIVPIKEGGKVVPENAVALCPNCNRKVALCPTDADIQILKNRAMKQLNA